MIALLLFLRVPLKIAFPIGLLLDVLLASLIVKLIS
jgi:hypothetical protein